MTRNKFTWILKNMAVKDSKIRKLITNNETISKDLIINFMTEFVKENEEKLKKIECDPSYKRCIELELQSVVKFKDSDMNMSG